MSASDKLSVDDLEQRNERLRKLVSMNFEVSSHGAEAMHYIIISDMYCEEDIEFFRRFLTKEFPDLKALILCGDMKVFSIKENAKFVFLCDDAMDPKEFETLRYMVKDKYGVQLFLLSSNGSTYSIPFSREDSGLVAVFDDHLLPVEQEDIRKQIVQGSPGTVVIFLDREGEMSVVSENWLEDQGWSRFSGEESRETIIGMLKETLLHGKPCRRGASMRVLADLLRESLGDANNVVSKAEFLEKSGLETYSVAVHKVGPDLQSPQDIIGNQRRTLSYIAQSMDVVRALVDNGETEKALEEIGSIQVAAAKMSGL